jgi:hypothetical protein
MRIFSMVRACSYANSGWHTVKNAVKYLPNVHYLMAAPGLVGPGLWALCANYFSCSEFAEVRKGPVRYLRVCGPVSTTVR